MDLLVPTLLLRSEVPRAAHYAATMLRSTRVPPEVWARVLEYAARVVDPEQARPLLRRACPITWMLPILSGRMCAAVIRGSTDATFLQMELVGPRDRVCHCDARLDRFIVRFLRTLERERLEDARGDLKLLTYDGIRSSLESMSEGWILRRSTLLHARKKVKRP